MQRHRVLIFFGIAWLSALLLSWWVYKNGTAPQSSRDVVYAVAAAQDLPVGKRLRPEDLKLIALDRKDLAKGAFLKAADVVDRAISVPVSAGELVLSGKLATKGSGEGLTSLIEPGMRAISVQVNEISGVSGFVQPGTRVDILFTRVFSNGDASTTTILQNVKVIAYGRQLDPAAKLDPRDTSKPTVATLLVSQEQAEKLVLAAQRGKIQLLLRNSLDDQITAPTEPIRSSDLGIEEPRKPMAAPLRTPAARMGAGVGPATQTQTKPAPETEDKSLPEAAPQPAQPASGAPKTGKQQNDGHVVRIFRGDKVTEIRFE